MAKFIANDGPFAVRVAPDLKVEIGTDEPVEVGVHSYKVTVPVRGADGMVEYRDVEKKVDVADRLRTAYRKQVSEVKDGEKPKRAADEKTDAKRGR